MWQASCPLLNWCGSTSDLRRGKAIKIFWLQLCTESFAGFKWSGVSEDIVGAKPGSWLTVYLRIFCFFTDEKSDSSLPLYVLPLYSLLAPEKQAKVKDLLSQWVNNPYRYVSSLSKVTCALWVKISILDYPSVGRFEWPNGQVGMGSEQALLGLGSP